MKSHPFCGSPFRSWEIRSNDIYDKWLAHPRVITLTQTLRSRPQCSTALICFYCTISTVMSDSSLAEFDAHWEALTRPSPRPAKTSVCPQTQRYYSYLTSIAYYILLPVFTVYWSIHWILVPSFPSWTFHRMLANRKAQLESNLGAFYLPTMDEERVRWNPAYLSPYGGLQTLEAYARAQSAEEVEIETVKLFPVAAVHRRGIGRGEWVKDELVPGFWLSPARASRARGKGDEPASQGEKVVLHLHGG